MKSVAITGTAQSWVMTPWNDPTVEVWSLNDAYRMKGFVRADRWFDLHPLDHFWSPPEGQIAYAHQVPSDKYARPHDHKAWLAKQVIPVYLHPDHVRQDPASAHWPSARAYPKAEVEAYFGRYFTSSPAWMMALAMLEGVKDIAIYGIHLATEDEYRHQRPQMEFLAGRFLGSGKLSVTVKDGLRYYETADARLVFPEASPVLQADRQYAFDPKPKTANKAQIQWEIHRFGIKRERAVAALKVAPWWQPTGKLQDELWRMDAAQIDAQEQLARLELAERWA